MEHGKVAAKMGDEIEAKAAFEKARENYAKAMESKPGWRSIAIGYIEACVRTGQYAKAVEVSEGLITSNRPVDVAYAFAFAGVAYAQMGQMEKAANMLDALPAGMGLGMVSRAARVQAAALRGGVVDADVVMANLDGAMQAQEAENDRSSDSGSNSDSESGGGHPEPPDGE